MNQSAYGVKRGKTYNGYQAGETNNGCQARENITDVKCGKTYNGCQARESEQRKPSAGKHNAKGGKTRIDHDMIEDVFRAVFI